MAEEFGDFVDPTPSRPLLFRTLGGRSGVRLTVEFDVMGSDLVVKHLALDTTHRPVDTEALRKIPVNELVQMARDRAKLSAAVHQSLLEAGALPDPAAVRRTRRAAAAIETADLRLGRTGYSEDFYRRIALRYLDLQEQQGSTGIISAIAEEESERQGRLIPYDTVKWWLQRAQRLQLLTKSDKPGIAHRRAGARLYEIKEGQR